MTTVEWDGRTWAHLTCGACGIEWIVPARFNQEKRDTGDSFYCPNGHCRAYKETTAILLRRRAERAEQEQARLADLARQERERAEVEAAIERMAGVKGE